MAVLKIRTWPDEVLKTKALAVGSVDDTVRRLMSDMAETMYRENGIGLAAPQVGVSRRVIVLDVPGEEEGEAGSGLILAANPAIVAKGGKCKITEGCLSFPGLEIDVERAERVTVEWLDGDGNPQRRDCQGLLAICFQHEIDHLDGIVFTDRIGLVRRRLALRDYARMQQEAR